MNDNISAFTSSEYEAGIRHTLPYYDEFYKQVIDAVTAYIPHALTWLDVGCGTGKMAEAAFNQAKIDRFVFCDCSKEMIKAAENRFFNLPNANFLVSDVRDLEFTDEFDVVTAIQVNHYLQKDERIAAVKKCYQALKTDGMFISFENFAPYSGLGEKLYLNRWKLYQSEQGKDLNECEKHISRYKKDYYPISVSEHLKLMKNCGFRAVEILWLSYMQVGLLGIK